MRPTRIIAISRKNLMTVVRQKRMLALMFIAPIIAMFLFGYAFSGHAQNVPAIVVNEDSGYTMNGTTIFVSKMVLANLNDQPPDNVNYSMTYVQNLSRALDMLSSGQAVVVLYFPGNFSINTFVNIQSHEYVENASVVTYVDNSQLTGGDSTPGAVSSAVSVVDLSLGQHFANQVSVTDYYGSDVSFMDYFIPGIIAFVVFFLPALMTLLLFVGEKTGGTYERLLSTPLTEGELVSGYAVTFGGLAVVQSVILFFSGVAAFNLDISKGFLLAILIIIIEAIGSLAFGILLSGLANRPEQAVQLLPFVVLPALTLSGSIMPIDVMPTWLQPVSYILPPTYATIALRDVLIKGWGLSQIWVYVTILLAFAVIFLSCATLLFKKRR